MAHVRPVERDSTGITHVEVHRIGRANLDFEVLGEGDHHVERGPDVADVGTAFDVVVALAEHFEIQIRTTDAVDLDVGDPCRLTLDKAYVSQWSTDEGVVLV